MTVTRLCNYKSFIAIKYLFETTTIVQVYLIVIFNYFNMNKNVNLYTLLIVSVYFSLALMYNFIYEPPSH